MQWQWRRFVADVIRRRRQPMISTSSNAFISSAQRGRPGACREKRLSAHHSVEKKRWRWLSVAFATKHLKIWVAALRVGYNSR